MSANGENNNTEEHMKKFMMVVAILTLIQLCAWWADGASTDHGKAVVGMAVITGDSIGPPGGEYHMVVVTQEERREDESIRIAIRARQERPDMAWAYAKIDTGLRSEVYFKIGPIVAQCGLLRGSALYTGNRWEARLSGVQLIIEQSAAQRGHLLIASLVSLVQFDTG
jgi:hypothetical protein